MLTVGVVGEKEYAQFCRIAKGGLRAFPVGKEPTGDVLLIQETPPAFRSLEQSCLLLIDTDCPPALTTGPKVYTVTYGLNSRATVTASSLLEPGRTVVCLQRRIEDCFGRVIEPQEFVIPFGEEEPRLMLAVAAAFLVCGKIDVLKFLSPS